VHLERWEYRSWSMNDGGSVLRLLIHSVLIHLLIESVLIHLLMLIHLLIHSVLVHHAPGPTASVSCSFSHFRSRWKLEVDRHRQVCSRHARMQHIATYCNTLQHTATCGAMQPYYLYYPYYYMCHDAALSFVPACEQSIARVCRRVT